MLIEGQFRVDAAPQDLIRHLFDTRLMASCLPGCEALEPLPDDRYRAVVVVAVAGIQARFNLQVQITARDELKVCAQTRGEEGGNASSLQAQTQVWLEPADPGTQVHYRSEVSVTGRLGRFGLGMMKKKAQSMGDEFAANLCANLQRVSTEDASAEAPAAAPMHAAAVPPGSWLHRQWRVLIAWWRGLRASATPH